MRFRSPPDANVFFRLGPGMVVLDVVSAIVGPALAARRYAEIFAVPTPPVLKGSTLPPGAPSNMALLAHPPAAPLTPEVLARVARDFEDGVPRLRVPPAWNEFVFDDALQPFASGGVPIPERVTDTTTILAALAVVAIAGVAGAVVLSRRRSGARGSRR